MAKSQRFEMRVTSRWLKTVDDAREGLGIRSRSDFVYLSAEAIARGDVVPAALLREAASIVEDVREHLKASGARRNLALVERLDDALHVITAAESLDLPEDLVWDNGR